MMNARSSFYRLARQHAFNTIVGHHAAKAYFLNAIEAGALPHALLIHGPAGVGKASMAFSIAKILNCINRTVSSCSCSACRKITDGVYSDLLVVEPRGAAGQITLSGWKPSKDEPDGMGYYRFIESAPLEGRRKVLVITAAERMNLALANYLLKLIEEPPSYLQLILLSHRPGDLLPTIRSRCAPVKLAPLTHAEMHEFASRLMPDIARETLAVFLRLSEGRPGKLIELLDSDPLTEQNVIADEMALFLEHGFPVLFRVAKKLVELGGESRGTAGDGLARTLSLMSTWMRDALLTKVTTQASSKRLATYVEETRLRQFAASTSLAGLAEAYEAVQALGEYVPRQTDRLYVVELMLTRIGRALRAR